MSAWLMRVGWFLAESEQKRMAFSSNNIKHERKEKYTVLLWIFDENMPQ